MSDPVQECTLGLEVSVTSTRPDFGPLPWKPSSEYRIDVDYWAWAVVEPGHQVYEHPEFNQDMTLATFDMTFPCMGVYTLIFTWGRHAIRYWYATGKTDEHFDTEEIKALAIIFDCGSGLGKPCVVILGTGVRGGLPERTPASAGAKRPAGPSAGDPPEICSGSEDYRPGVDLAVYNPNGPEFIFERNWRTDLATGQIGSPGLAEGWAHNWDVRLNPMGEACTWHGLEVRYPSGRGETITPLVDGSGAPTGLFEIPDGLGFEAVGDPGPNIGEWWSITFTFADGSTWRFTPHRSGYYALTRVGNALGQYLAFGYDDIRRLVEVTDAATDEVLATLTYGEDGYLSQIVDTYGRLVAYTHEQLTGDGYGYEDLTALTQVSQVVPFDEDTPPMRWQYDYAAVSALPDGYGYGYGQPDDCPYEEQGHYHGVDYYGVGGGPWRDTILLLNTITVPSPTQQGEETATLRYYDTTYRLCEQIDANGVRTVFIYESGTTTAYVVDADSDIVQTTEYSFDSNGMLTSSTCAGCPTSFEYNDPLNPYKPTKVTAADGKVTTFSYDSKGNLTSTTDPRGVTLTYTYDYDDFALGRLVKVERTVGGSTITLNEYTYYEPSGLTETAKSLKPGTTSAELVTTSYTYDDLGNVLTVTTLGNDAASTITTTYEYDTDGSYSQTAKRGQPLYVEDALGHQTHFRYDERANRTETTDALGSTWRTFYNLANQVTRSEQPATDQTGSGHATVLNTYLYVGGPQTDVTVLDEGGDVVQHINYHYGQEGELLSVTGGTEPVTYTYNALYQQETLTDGDGHTTTFAYDTKQRLKLIRYPLASADTGYDTVRFTLYDDAGRLLQRIDGRDIVTNYSYTEAGGALTDIAYPDHSAQDVSFGYDALGRRTSMSDAEGSHSYGYDDAGTLLSHAVTYTGLSAKTVSYTYYDNGSRATMTTPAGTQTYGYDEAGRMTSLQYGLGTASWAYQDNNLLSQQTLPGSVPSLV